MVKQDSDASHQANQFASRATSASLAATKGAVVAGQVNGESGEKVETGFRLGDDAGKSNDDLVARPLANTFPAAKPTLGKNGTDDWASL